MFRRINIAAILTLVFVFASSAFAQTAAVSGRVMLKKADGTVVPMTAGVVEAIQLDIKGSPMASKIDKKGYFSFAGLRLGVDYALSISGPGAAPTYQAGIKAGMEGIAITVDEGDGSKLNDADVRAAAKSKGGAGAASAPREESAEEKKRRAEFEAKSKEIAAKNANAEKVNTTTQRTLNEGNAAFKALDYDLAIAKYDEGIAAAPDYAGSAPVLLSNRGIALRERGVKKYQLGVKEKNAEAKVAAQKDFSASISSFERALAVLKAAAPGDIDAKDVEARKLDALRGLDDTFQLMIKTRLVDAEKAPVAKAFIPDYIALETDPARKARAVSIVADMYMGAGDSENAVIEYRSILAASPDNIEAMAGLGLSLINVGYINNDKSAMQEGANILQKFASAAPDTHPLKQDAIATIENLKKEQNVAPVKATGGKKKN